MPDFWVAILLIILFAATLQWLPAIGYSPLSEGFWPWFSHLILPAIAIGTAFSAIIARMIRSAMLEVLKTDYMQVARSKGLVFRVLIMRHAFPNALIPVVTVMGIAFALLMAGAVVVENVFASKAAKMKRARTMRPKRPFLSRQVADANCRQPRRRRNGKSSSMGNPVSVICRNESLGR